MQIIASWSVSGDINPSPEPSIGMANLFCQITGAGDLVVSAPAVSGGYNISAPVSTLGPVQFDLRVEVGGTEVLHQTGVTPANVRFILQPQVVLHSGVAFHGEQQTLIHGEGTGMRLGTPTQHPLDLCAETIWHQKMPTSFTIVQGATLGSFYDTSGTRIGTSVQWTEETVGAIMFVADGDQPAAEGEDVIIEASNITGVLGQTTIRVFPFVETIVVDHFEVTAGTDTLEYGNSTPLAIVAKDPQGREPQGEDQDFLVTLSLEGEGGPLGSFAVTAPSLDTTFIFPDQFAFSYLVYRSGVFSIAYLANGDVPTGSDPATVTIRAVMANNPEVFGEKQVVVRREAPNNPPVITSVAFEPSRRYFAYGSEVSIQAEAVDPDSDTVTISYVPGRTFSLTTLGPVEVAITATDSRGASTTHTETIYSVAVGITPSVERVIDGGNLNFRVFIAPEEIMASSFQWEWEPVDPNGGNNPSVNFQPSATVQEVTVTHAKWYASPDVECGARAEATYLLIGSVVFDGDELETEKVTMTVILDRKGGGTFAPDILGYPGVAAVRDHRGDVVKVRVDNIGTLRQVDPTSVIFIPRTSQFFEKVKAHEDVHVAQFKTGIAKDLWSVEKLFKRLKNLNAVSEMLLEVEINTEIAKFNNEQKVLYRKLWDQMEIDAYTISDPIPPSYFYQRCGRSTFPKP